MKPRLLLLLPLCLLLGADRHGDQEARPVPHPHDPILRGEHLALLDLVPTQAATHTAVRSGPWSAPGTWKEGHVPGAGARVWVPEGLTATLDRVHAPALRTVRVDGTLRFAPDRDTGLTVDTLVITPEGSLEIGTREKPIAPGKQARIRFADGGPIDTAWDPTLLSRGLLAHGTVRLHGAPVTPFVALARPPARGDTRLVLARPPAGWKKGDRLILTGTGLKNQDEELRVLEIRGNEVKVRPLDHDHAAPAEGLSAYVANVTRNVVLESENLPDPKRRGHVMFMHSPRVQVCYAGFYSLGRTDKRQPINDPRLEGGKLAKGTGRNPRGRYAVHVHRTGFAGKAPVLVRGCAVVDSPGWGFVNHSSNVAFEDNVAYRVAGAAFVTEAGDEVGAFRRNLAVRTVGSGEDVIARTRLQDFAHEGDGFWFQGGGVEVEGNIAAGHHTGFIFFTQGLEEEGRGVRFFHAANLPDPSLAPYLKSLENKHRSPDPGEVSVQMVPVRRFRDNVAFACRVGIIVRFHLTPRHRLQSVLEGGAVWNCTTGVEILYTANVTLRNLRLVGNAREKTLNAVRGGNEGLGGLRYENLRVEGWPFGLVIPESGDNVIRGGYYNNEVSILIPTRLQPDRSVDIRGDIRFGTLGPEDLHGRKQYDIYLGAYLSQFLTGRPGRDPNRLFLGDVIRYHDKQLYYPEQAADYVPFKERVAPGEEKRYGRPAGSLPPELIGKTNRQLWDRYGLALGGAVAPPGAATSPRIHGLIGKPAAYARPQELWFPWAAPGLRGFRLTCTGKNKQKVAESAPVDLRPGWNLITLPVQGQRRSFLVYGGKVAAPEKKYSKPR